MSAMPPASHYRMDPIKRRHLVALPQNGIVEDRLDEISTVPPKAITG